MFPILLHYWTLMTSMHIKSHYTGCSISQTVSLNLWLSSEDNSMVNRDNCNGIAWKFINQSLNTRSVIWKKTHFSNFDWKQRILSDWVCTAKSKLLERKRSKLWVRIYSIFLLNWATGLVLTPARCESDTKGKSNTGRVYLARSEIYSMLIL